MPVVAGRLARPYWRRENLLPTLTTITDEARIVFDNVLDTAIGGGTPSVRLGVTGLSRAGKTVFITALVHNLLHGGRLARRRNLNEVDYI